MELIQDVLALMDYNYMSLLLEENHSLGSKPLSLMMLYVTPLLLLDQYSWKMLNSTMLEKVTIQFNTPTLENVEEIEP